MEKTNHKKQVAVIVIAVLVATLTITFLPIVPVQAELVSGTAPTPEWAQKILLAGNYSVNFELSDFQGTIEDLKITAETFTVTAFTETVANKTTGFIRMDLTNVDVTRDNVNTFNLHVGSATLDMDIYMVGGYINYSFYSQSTTSLAEMLGNLLSNLT